MDIVIHQYFDLNVMSDNFTFVLKGFGETLQLWAVSSVLSLILGLILAVVRQSRARVVSVQLGRRRVEVDVLAPVRFLTIAYIDVFRGIPLLLVILLISGSLPFLPIPESIAIPEWFGKPDPFWYGVMAITITYGAYMAEVYRAGIEAVPGGQMEAARSLGMSHGQAMRQVIVPQAVRKVIPPLLNDLIALMKDTSLVGVIALIEVVEAGRTVQAETLNSSALTLGAIMFVIVTIPMARLVDRLIASQQERFERGTAGPLGEMA
jgi:polar amino acid transport system permease protein